MRTWLNISTTAALARVQISWAATSSSFMQVGGIAVAAGACAVAGSDETAVSAGDGAQPMAHGAFEGALPVRSLQNGRVSLSGAR